MRVLPTTQKAKPEKFYVSMHTWRATVVSSRATVFVPRIVMMMINRTLLSVLLLSLCLISLNAQTKSGADDYNAIFKPLKWRAIGPFRGGRSNCSTGVVG